MMLHRRVSFAVVTAIVMGLLVWAASPFAQQIMNTNPVTLQTVYSLVAISNTGAVNTQTTLTIPAPPPSFYNYVCTLHLNASQDGTGTVITNGTTSSTNFGGYAQKFSNVLTVNGNYDLYENWGIANVGCVKSTSPGTATTFVSPGVTLHTAFTWDGTYYQAP
jgi:hypothetical protein